MLPDPFAKAIGLDRWLLPGHGRRVAVAPGSLLGGDVRTLRRPSHPVTRGPEVPAPFKTLWARLDCLSGRAALPEASAGLQAQKETRVSGRARQKLPAISSGTMGGLPFPLPGLDSDSGGESNNDLTLRRCRQVGKTFTRSRPHRNTCTCNVR